MGQILSIEEQPCSTSTEDRILDAALTIIQEKTISGLRIRQVAEKANLFQSNIHYYYNSKKELLLAVQKKVLNRYREIRQQSIHQSGFGPEATLEDRLDIFIKQKIYTILIDNKYDVAELDFWNQSRLDPDMHQEFCLSYQNWRTEIREIAETFAPDMPSAKQNLIAGIAVSLLEGAAVQFLVDKEAFDLDSYFAYCKSILIREIRG